MKFAVIVVDIHKDALKGSPDNLLVQQRRAIIPRIKFLVDEARKLNGVIVFALGSYFEKDFLFKGKLHPFAIRGTKGAELIDEFEVHAEDINLPKRRFSAFFRTDLDITLRTLNLDTIAVAGINTDDCVFSTAIDGICNDLNVVVISDCTAARNREIHETMISILSNSTNYPLLRVRTAEEFLAEAKENRILEA
jgi:nicotinamidase/pyrazinamidase